MDRERYAAWRENFETKFASASLIEGSTEQHASPSGEYVLEISAYQLPNSGWGYSRGLVREARSGATLADFKRNYPGFWHAWVAHPNGNEYLLCGEDYQGYSVLECQSGRTETYFPDQGFDGHGFCWAAVHPSPDGRTLAVDGCYWACPYELRFVDFNRPLDLPLKELGCIEDFDDTVGWKSHEVFEYLGGEESQREVRQWSRGASAEP